METDNYKRYIERLFFHQIKNLTMKNYAKNAQAESKKIEVIA